ncbi:MAG: T9SS type A sorting domain-containing protein, partial [Bacteroidales bacterium]|nr:T9SS type A sorting domain-containing protein [Bacteroidales bacterium]
LSSHQTMNIVWDCHDLNGDVVPDGEYVLWVEFTEKHAQGPLTSVAFNKGTEPVHLTPADEANFINMVFDYTPTGVGIQDVNPKSMITVYPNPSTGVFYLKNEASSVLQVVVYSVSGKVMERKVISPASNYKLDLSGYEKGYYLLRISGNNQTEVIRFSVI